jgi:hypothetical protein
VGGVTHSRTRLVASLSLTHTQQSSDDYEYEDEEEEERKPAAKPARRRRRPAAPAVAVDGAASAAALPELPTADELTEPGALRKMLKEAVRNAQNVRGREREREGGRGALTHSHSCMCAPHAGSDSGTRKA